jgi:hypothetical protein
MRSSQMNATAVRTAGRYLGAWGAIVFGVILLSVIFTFLGTITCAVLVGMMMGAVKGARWFSVLVSFVFPAVIFGMVRTTRMELTPQQVIVLGTLCFGTFWATYLVSAFVFFCEQRERKLPGVSIPASQLEQPVQGGQVADSCVSMVPMGQSGLEQLQGNWVREASSAVESVTRQMIQITEARLELKAIDASGRTTLLGEGAVTLQSMRPAHLLAIPQGAAEPADFIVGL